MKKVFYGAGLVSLPVIYVGLMLATGEPIEWGVLGLMALILASLFFWKAIGKVEKNFNTLSDEEKIKVVTTAAKKIASKVAGVGH